ncbi:hypothetical protein GCM10023147_20950 [Tsukamurella soli]|uniref:HNH domain-containing protein n=2 Tax=Tsukamurella soli TaxID=644556 RepID=A0ABP8JJU2_9ACTN
MSKRAGRSDGRWKKQRAKLVKQVQAAGTPCPLCGEAFVFDDWRSPLYPHMDHIIPLSQLAPGDPRRQESLNTRLVHAECNRKRGNRIRAGYDQPNLTEW